MTFELSLTMWTFARLLAAALFLVLLVRGMRLVIRLAPMSVARRRSLEQAFPVVELLVGTLYLVAVVQELFREAPTLGAIAVLGVLFGALWIARFALLDLLTGVLMRTSGSVARGDRVRLDGVEGRVTSLGYQVLSIETRWGDEALVPYSRLSRQAVVRTPHVDGAHRHTFRLEGAERPAPERIRQLALLCHWSSVSRVPVVEFDDDGTCEVTVFALAPDRGPDVEAFVRRSLG